MRKCLVGLRHLVNFIALANRVPLPLVCLHDFSGQRYGTLERETGSRPPVVYAPDGRRRYETDRDGTLRDPYGRRIEVLKPLPDGDW